MNQPAPDHKCGDAAIGVLQAIDRALHDSTASEILDENSPIRDAMRDVLKTVAGRHYCTAPMQPSDRQILDACSGIFYADYDEGEDYDLAIARAVLALAAPTQAPMQPSALTQSEIQDVRKYLDDWGCLANPLVVRLLRSASLDAPTQAAPAAAVDYSAIEREHFGDPDKETGIYAKRAAAAPEGLAERNAHYGGNSYEASMLRNLLARIHRDGGHYLDQHGLDKALEDADALVVQWIASHDAKAADSERLQWLIDKEMLFAWPTQWTGGSYSNLRAIGTISAEGIESKDVRQVIDAAIAASTKDKP